MFTKSQLQRMRAMDLARLAGEWGIPEHRVWKLRGGPVRKEILIAYILERAGEKPAHLRGRGMGRGIYGWTCTR